RPRLVRDRGACDNHTMTTSDPLSVAAEAARRFLAGVADRPVGSAATPAELTAALGGPLAEDGVDAAQVVADLARAADPGIVGAEAHVTIFTSLRLLGLGAARVRTVAADEQGRMRPDALRDALAGGKGPAIVCAQLGNVNTGACDLLEEIAPLARGRGAWLHVDGAFGLWAATSPRHRHLTAGAARADSWATDAHKWLNVPYDSGV